MEEHQNGIYKNRVNIGLDIEKIFMLEHLKGSMYLRWEITEKNDVGEDTYLVGTKLMVHF